MVNRPKSLDLHQICQNWKQATSSHNWKHFYMSFSDEIARDVDERYFELRQISMTFEEVSEALREAMRRKEDQLKAMAIDDVARRRHLDPVEVRRAWFATQD